MFAVSSATLGYIKNQKTTTVRSVTLKYTKKKNYHTGEQFQNLLKNRSNKQINSNTHTHDR